jgi:hypothetical protein
MDLEVKNYMDKFMLAHEPSFEAYDAAIAAFKSGVPAFKASCAFEPTVIEPPGGRRVPYRRYREDAMTTIGHGDDIYARHAVEPIADAKCAECGIPLRPEQAKLVHGSQKVQRCDCCATMIDSCGQQPGLVQAQAEYEQENARRVRDKIRIMKG